MKSSPTNHHIVFLQAAFCPVPDFEFPDNFTYTTTVHQKTSLSELHARIHDASILVLSAIRIDAVALSPEVTPHLKFIAVVATGTDCVDLEACKARGIVVCNCPNANVESVSEHAIGMYFATRRKMLDLHALTRAGEWPKRGTLMYQMLGADGQPPLTCQEEVVGIVGYGGVGKRIARLARALGMKVLVSGRKDASATSPSNTDTISDEERIPFADIIRQCTVIFVAVPLLNSTRNLLSTPEFEAISPHAVLVNVSRGGVVDEEALVAALKERRIAGAATDVFREEPAGLENSPLLRDDTRDLNLLVTPHLAWLAQMTWVNQSKMLKRIVEEWCAGRPFNLVT